MLSSEELSGQRTHDIGARLAALARTVVRTEGASVDLGALRSATALGGIASRFIDKSVLVATRSQIASAVALVELDGVARRLTIAPPDVTSAHLAAIREDAKIDAIVSDHPEDFASLDVPLMAAITLPLAPSKAPARDIDTEWVLMTSGTSGRPKLAVHRLSALTAAIQGGPPGVADPVWSTFYDIRRYGGLQIFLRAILGNADIVLSRPNEPLVDHLYRLAACGVTAISGTPSHWRRVLMSHERGAFRPRYVRLSGEIADQLVLDGLRAAFPSAVIEHAYASTEAGVGFAIGDGREGFPANLIENPQGDVTLKIVDGSLRVRSTRAASRYLGENAPALADADGFVDTGDLVDLRCDRYTFVGRRGGIINVGGLKVNPEEVEAVINAHHAVRMSLVKARKNPLTGALVIADIVLRDPDAGSDDLKREILEACNGDLERHKVPALIRFVPGLPLTPGGKLSRAQG